jgi:type IV secretory pathway VirB10-like protein
LISKKKERKKKCSHSQNFKNLLTIYIHTSTHTNHHIFEFNANHSKLAIADSPIVLLANDFFSSFLSVLSLLKEIFPWKRRQFENPFQKMAAPPPTRRTTRQVSRRLKDLTNNERQGKKTKKSFTRKKTIGDAPPSSSLNVSAPDSRPSRMTASIVVQASSEKSREEEEEEKHKKQRDEEEEEEEKEGKKKQQKTRKRTRREEQEEEDVLDLTCDEEPILLQRRRRSGDTAGGTFACFFPF